MVIFSQACVKNSVHGGGGCLPQCMLGYTPPEQTPPDQAPPGTTHIPPPRDQTPPGSGTPRYQTPWSRHPPDQAPPTTPAPPGPDPPHPEQTPPSPGPDPPPRKQTAAYGQRAAGTHPTGMHSCIKLFYDSDKRTDKCTPIPRPKRLQ